MVSLQYFDIFQQTYLFFCTGSMLTIDTAISAAHCLHDKPSRFGFLGILSNSPISTFEINLASQNLHMVTHVIFHPQV